MKTNNTATAIKRLALATTLVLVITISISARAAETFQGAMNHGLAYFQAQDFANANAWFSYARRMRPNDRGAIFWTSNSAGYQFAKSGQWAHSAHSPPDRARTYLRQNVRITLAAEWCGVPAIRRAGAPCATRARQGRDKPAPPARCTALPARLLDAVRGIENDGAAGFRHDRQRAHIRHQRVIAK